MTRLGSQRHKKKTFVSISTGKISNRVKNQYQLPTPKDNNAVPQN